MIIAIKERKRQHEKTKSNKNHKQYLRPTLNVFLKKKNN